MTDEIIIPYNINNVLITIDVNIKNINLFHIALTHKSYIISEYTNYNNNILKSVKEKMDSSVVELMNESSERIEFFGDSVIKCIVAKYLYSRYYKDIMNDTNVQKAFYTAPSLLNYFTSALKNKKARGSGIFPAYNLINNIFNQKIKDKLPGFTDKENKRASFIFNDEVLIYYKTLKDEKKQASNNLPQG
jgi:dsRNA-specific ribonuclease